MHDKNIFTNPCSEKWADMSGDDRARICAKCNEKVHDISERSLAEVSASYIDSNRCVKMNQDQLQFFQFLRSIPKVAGLSAALSLYPFADAQVVGLLFGHCDFLAGSRRTRRPSSASVSVALAVKPTRPSVSDTVSPE